MRHELVYHSPYTDQAKVGQLRTHGLILGRGNRLLLSPEHLTSCRAHSTAYSVGTKVSSPGVKWSECDIGHTLPYSHGKDHLMCKVRFSFIMTYSKITFVLPIHWTCKRVIKDPATAVLDIWVLRNVKDDHQRARWTWKSKLVVVYVELWGQSPQYPLNRRLGPKACVDALKRKMLPVPGMKPWFISFPVHSLVCVPTMLSQLRVCDMNWTVHIMYFDRFWRQGMKAGPNWTTKGKNILLWSNTQSVNVTARSQRR